MRYLIDGYNLMHALGLMRPRFGPRGLRNARQRFLNQLAAALGPTESAACTVVFDAREPPGHLGREANHKGLSIVFAVDEADADERIETLISADSAPKSLTVVSSDHRLRRAAARRGARPLSADEFAARMRAPRLAKPAPPPSTPEPERPKPSSRESREWQAIFGDLDADLADLNRSETGLTDEEIRRIQREVEEEFRREDSGSR
jgi:predicted RNA-binding protein with PIN domain